MTERGLEILTQRDDVDLGRPEILECLEDLLAGLSQTQHETRFGVERGLGSFLGQLQDGQGSIVCCPMPYRRCEAADCLDVVVVDLGLRRQDKVDSPGSLEKIRNEYFNGDARVEGPDGLDGLAEMFGATVVEVISSHGRDHHVLQSHPAGGLGDALGFVGLQWQGLGGIDRAEAAGAGASIPGDHESGRTAAPTLPVIRTLGAFADGVQPEVRKQEARPGEDAGTGERHFQPRGQTGAHPDRGRRRALRGRGGV